MVEGFRVGGLGIQGLGFRDKGFRVSGSGFRVWIWGIDSRFQGELTEVKTLLKR